MLYRNYLEMIFPYSLLRTRKPMLVWGRVHGCTQASVTESLSGAAGRYLPRRAACEPESYPDSPVPLLLGRDAGKESGSYYIIIAYILGL